MECCYADECGEYAVSPVLVPSCYPKCEPVPMCYPCLPHCPKIIYCCAPPRGAKRRECCDDYQPIYCERCREHDHERCCEHDHEVRCHRRSSTPPCARASMPCCVRSSTPCCPASCAPSEPACCKPVRTKYVIPCYRYEDGRIVQKLPVTAFKRNGMQDQEHSKMLGTANFLQRCPRDVSIECDICTDPVKVGDPAKNQPTLLMRRACEVAVGNRLRKKPFVVSSDYQDPYNEVHRYHSEDEKGNFCFHIERKKPMTKIEDPGKVQPCTSCPQCTYADSDCIQAKAINPKNCCYYCD